MSLASSSSSGENSESSSVRPRKRRCNHPKATTDYLIRWVVDHIVEPYPTEQEKIYLCQEANLTPKQLEDWFTNLRRRKLDQIRKDMGIDPRLIAQQVPSRRRYSSTLSENYPSVPIEKHSAIKRQCTSNKYLENDRPEASHSSVVPCSHQPGVSILKRENSLSIPSQSSNDLNQSSYVGNDSNLRLLCWVALNNS